MREFQQKRKNLKLLYSKLSLIILFALLIFAIHGVWEVYGKEKASVALKAQSDAELAALQTEQTQLSQQNGELSTPQGVERQIRLDYHMIKPGEQLAVIVNESSSTDGITDGVAQVASVSATAPSATSASTDQSLAPHSIWQSIAHFFSSLF